MSDETALAAHQQEYAAATSEDAKRAAAAAAGSLLGRVEGDLFSSANEVRAAMTARLSRDFLAAITVATPKMAAAALRGRLLDGCAGAVALDGDGRVLEKLCANAEAVPGDAALAKAAASCLEDEALATGDGRVRDGAGFEKAAFLEPLLAVGPIPPWDAFARPGPRLVDPVGAGAPRHPSLSYFRGLSGFPRSHDYERQALFLRSRNRRALDAAVKIVEKALKSKTARQGVLAWLARALALGAPLSETRVRQDRAWHPSDAPSPMFGVNVAALALRLAAPLWEKGLGSKVDWRYALRDERVAFSSSEPLFQGDGAAADDASDSDDDEDLTAEEKRLMKQALEMSLKPATPGFFPKDDAPDFSFITEIFFLAHKAVSAYVLPLWAEFGHQQQFLHDAGQGRVAPEVLEKRSRMHADGWLCALEDPRLLEDAAALATFSTDWLLAQLSAPDARDRASRLPAALVKDACDLWSTLARCAERSSAAAARTGTAASFGAHEASKAVLACCELMRHGLVESPIVHAKMVDFVCELLRAGGRRRPRGGARFGADAGLAGAVLDSERVRRALPAALAHLYTAVQAVVGLDVDSDDAIDKFSVRRRLNALLLTFWRYPLREPRQALLDFLGDAAKGKELGLAFLDTVVYCGEDALGRLADGKAREKNGKPPDERARERGFWEGQRRACRGFLPIAESTLELLAELCAEPAARDALLKGPEALARTAAWGAIVVGRAGTAKGRDLLAVAEPKDWLFDAGRLLERTAAVLDHARKAHGDAAWAAAVVADAGFEKASLDEASEAPGGAGLHATRDAVNGLGAAAETVDARSAVDAALKRLGAGGGADAYAAALEDTQVDVVEGLGDHAFSSRAGGAPNARALQKELRKLQRDLPQPHADGSVWVRFDESRLDLCRCGVSGPAGTPYAGGLFVFDIWFPPTYPAVPPLVAIVTTGKGTVRFNPNLYADGKVCLSLLGTWHAGDASEKWTPETGSLRQVLLSIQHQILVAEPYFNEPGREAARGTRDGAAASAAQNAYLRAATLQHAVVDHLATPPRGLEDVAALHLHHASPGLLARCRAELDGADPASHRALHRAAAALAEHVSKMEPPKKRSKSSDSD